MSNQLTQFEAIEGADYWIKMVKCQHACPVHTNACGYVTSIAEGRYEDAYKMARATNPFASICGRVCGAPCEINCRRGDVDEPISIRALKRFVTDKFGPEAGNAAMHHAGCDQRMLPPNRGDYEKVAVIGAGVSGLTVAHDLVQVGYKVTVFESNPEP
ncbi:MAG: FAD-dependent oxidoreductase, partial [Terriglobales bacterium]